MSLHRLLIIGLGSLIGIGMSVLMNQAQPEPVDNHTPIVEQAVPYPAPPMGVPIAYPPPSDVDVAPFVPTATPPIVRWTATPGPSITPGCSGDVGCP
jgi:hypothetical protein